MKLKDILPLEIDAKALAKETGLSSRQIRKLRAGGREVPNHDFSPEQVTKMLETKKNRTAQSDARDAWYLAEKKLLDTLRELDHQAQAAMILGHDHPKELHELLTQFDVEIQEALKMRGAATREAHKLGVKAIWLADVKAIDKLLMAHNRRLQDVTNALEKPSESMRRRIITKLAVT
jgi:hypothetical protein